MKKVIAFLSIATLVCIVVLTAIGCSPTKTNMQIAEDFVKNEATYVFDGIPESFGLAETLVAQDPNGNHFSFAYQSRHAGYGDRTDQILAQVITNHRAEITITDGKVTDAVLDGKWDMLQQKMITGN